MFKLVCGGFEQKKKRANTWPDEEQRFSAWSQEAGRTRQDENEQRLQSDIADLWTRTKRSHGRHKERKNKMTQTMTARKIFAKIPTVRKALAELPLKLLNF